MKAGTISVRINNKDYIIPDVYLFKSPDNKDCYLSGISCSYNNYGKITSSKAYIYRIEEAKIEEVPFEKVEKYLIYYKIITIDDKSFSIPIRFIDLFKDDLKDYYKQKHKVFKDKILEKYNEFLN